MPLLRERRRFAGSADFRLYDVVADGGGARRGRLRLLERARRRPLADRLPQPVRRRRPAGSATPCRSPSRRDDGSKTMRRDTLADALGSGGAGRRLAALPRPRDPAWSTLRSVGEIRDRGLHVELGRLRLPRPRRAARGRVDRRRAVGRAGGRARRAAGAVARRGPRRPPAAAGPRPRRGGCSTAMDRGAGAGGRWRSRGTTVDGGVDRLRDSLESAPPACTCPSIRRRGRRSDSPLDAGFGRLRSARPRAAMDPAIERTARARLAHPRRCRTWRSHAWLADPDVRGVPRGPRLGRRRVARGERWIDLVDLAGALDRASGAEPGVAGDRPSSAAAAVAVGRRIADAALARGAARPRGEPRSPTRRRAAPKRPEPAAQPRSEPPQQRHRRRAVAHARPRGARGRRSPACRRSRRRPAAPARRRRRRLARPRPPPGAGPRARGPRTRSSRRNRSTAGSTTAGPGRTSPGPPPPPGTPPSTISETASSSVMPAVWIPTSISAFATAPQVVLPMGQQQRRVVRAVPGVHHHLGHVDRPALGEDAAPEDRPGDRRAAVGVDALEVVARAPPRGSSAAGASGRCPRGAYDSACSGGPVVGDRRDREDRLLAALERPGRARASPRRTRAGRPASSRSRAARRPAR